MNEDTKFDIIEIMELSIEDMEIPYLISDTFCDVIDNLNHSGIEYDFKDVKKTYISMILEELDFDEYDLSELIGEP